jgi:7,8-dihydropterin-6-yl-methyl-4-(beta-D-ribofuranosyl)aminobenzene 5'-phosphate synthase
MNAEELRITVVVDNHAAPGLTAEHGLSLLIDTGRHRILFDTGQGPALAVNARALGIDLRRVDTLVLSHGHYDHSGGLPLVLDACDRIGVYAHAGVVQPRYSIRDGQARLISMPHEAMAALDRLDSDRLHWVPTPVWLDSTIGLTGPIERRTRFEDTGGPFFLDPEGSRADPIVDDLALWVRTGEGLVVCVGCSHAGLINTLNQIRRLDPDRPIRAVIGGFHLVAASEERLAHTVAALRDIAPRSVMPCHCTGDGATAFLKETLGAMVQPASAGMTFQF